MLGTVLLPISCCLMKRCPECRRDYFDDTLLYCLDDGAALLEGPGSFEPRTEIIPSESKRGGTVHTEETRIYPSNPSGTVPSVKRTSAIAAIAAVVLLLAAAGYGIYRYSKGSSTPPSSRSSANVEVQRLTGDGKTRGAVVSPDGKLIAYIRTEGAERSIWIKQIATNSAIQLVKPGELDRFEYLTFSPDGIFLYFNAEPQTDAPPSVYRVSTLGGTPTKALNNATSVEFAPDGKQLSFGRFDLSTNETSIFIANIDGTGERKIASKVGTEFFDPEHSWSPDGKSIVAIAGDDNKLPEPAGSLVIVPVAGGDLTVLGPPWVSLDDVAWHPSGDSILVAGTDTARTDQIWEVAFPTGERRRLTNNLSGHYSVSVTSDGSSIVTGEVAARSALWVSPDVKPENAKQIMPATADTWGLAWTLDNRIVYVSEQSGEAELWVIDADGSNATQLTSDKASKTTPVVSADGRYIVYTSSANGGQIERIDANGGNRLVLTRPTGADNPDISRDGKSVIYSAYEDGESKIFRVGIDGGDPQTLTEYKATEPRFSRDGTRFACFIPNETTRVWTKIAIAHAEGGKPIKILDAPPNTNITRGPIWTPDDTAITVVIAEGEKQNLWLLPIDGSPGKRMTNFEVPGIARRDYSRDGKRIAIIRAEGIGNAIMITNFR